MREGLRDLRSMYGYLSLVILADDGRLVLAHTYTEMTRMLFSVTFDSMETNPKERSRAFCNAILNDSSSSTRRCRSDQRRRNGHSLAPSTKITRALEPASLLPYLLLDIYVRPHTGQGTFAPGRAWW